MMYLRVMYDGYFEGEYESEDDAVKAFLEFMREEVEVADIDVERFDEEKKEWV